MKQTDINKNKMTGEWVKHIRRGMRRELNKLRRSFLKKHMIKQLESE